MSKDPHLEQDFRQILAAQVYTSQAEIVDALKDKGHMSMNQSKVSRMLHKFGAVRVRNAQLQTVYCLPTELVTPSAESPVKRLVLDIDYNDFLVVVKTSPGAAQLIGRVLDGYGKEDGILGTLAGDDTIFITPTRDITAHALADKIWQIF